VAPPAASSNETPQEKAWKANRYGRKKKSGGIGRTRDNDERDGGRRRRWGGAREAEMGGRAWEREVREGVGRHKKNSYPSV
jgi:hypothetical protein